METLAIKLVEAIAEQRQILNGLEQEILNYQVFLENEIARMKKELND